MKTRFYLAFLLAGSTAAFGQAPKVTPYFSWHQKNQSILSPAFSHSDSELVFVQQFQVPDGNAVAGHKTSLDSLRVVMEKDPRFADPVVTTLNLRTRALTRVDWGWTPTFSPDDKELIYSFQKVPLSDKRVLTQTLAGNSIKRYSRNARKDETLALPAETFLLDPLFTGTTTALYKGGNAVNGSYGGGVSLYTLNLSSHVSTSLYAAQKSHGLPHLIGDVYQSGTQTLFTVYIPQDSAGYMADNYAHLLKNASGTTIHNFGTGPFESLSGKVATDAAGTLLCVEEGEAAGKAFLVKYVGNKRVSRKALPFEYHIALLSPNGKYLLLSTLDNRLYLLNTADLSKTRLTLPGREFFGVNWSADSGRLAIVQEGEGEGDVVSLFEVG